MSILARISLAFSYEKIKKIEIKAPFEEVRDNSNWEILEIQLVKTSSIIEKNSHVLGESQYRF